MAQFRNFDPLRVVFGFGPVVGMGYAAGTFISAERAEDAFTTVAGALGDVTRTRNRNAVGTVTVTFMAASPANAIMQAVYDSDQLLGLGRYPLYVSDLNGTVLMNASSAWIKKLPTVAYAVDGDGTREWMIDCAELNMSLGGAFV